MKIIRILNSITVILKNGEIISSDICTDEMFNLIYNNQDDEELIKEILIPEFTTKKKLIEVKKSLLENASNSKYLVTKGNSIYIPTISELSVPEDLVNAIIKAENNNNEELIQTYLNFWTLVSLNPDSRCRQNLFWFLNKYGMTISKSGLFVAYRNVHIKKEGTNIKAELANFISSKYSQIKFVNKKFPKNYTVIEENGVYSIVPINHQIDGDVIGNLDELYKELSNLEVSTIYTDGYTKSFNIKLGEIVSIPREKCDSTQENTCSRGLHVAGKDWLQANYFGDVGLMVLVNPADVVAVPPEDNYGKMRTCAYFPILNVKVENRKLEEVDIPNGFEDDFFNIMINYNGKINNEDVGQYQIIPEKPTEDFNEKKILNKLSEIKLLLSKREAE